MKLEGNFGPVIVYGGLGVFYYLSLWDSIYDDDAHCIFQFCNFKQTGAKMVTFLFYYHNCLIPSALVG